MAEKTEEKKRFRLIHWIGENPEWLMILGTVAAGVLRGRVSADADDKAKKAAAAMGMSVGGEGDPADEAAYKRTISKIGDDVNRDLLQRVWRKVVVAVFELEHPEKYRRDAGHDAFQEWRKSITKMEQQNAQDAIDYLTNLAKSALYKFIEECKYRGLKPVSDNGDLNESPEAWEATYAHIRHQMTADATLLPDGAKPFFQKLKEVVEQVGTKGTTHGKRFWRKLPRRLRFWRHVVRRKTAFLFDEETYEPIGNTVMEREYKSRRHADDLETAEKDLPWFDRFLNRILPF